MGEWRVGQILDFEWSIGGDAAVAVLLRALRLRRDEVTGNW